MAIARSVAQDRALEVIKAALSSNSIKLEGANSSGYNKEHLAADSEYLSGLIKALTETIYQDLKSREQT